jgi:hypothetical protein
MITFRIKRPEKWRTNSWFLLHDNAPAHRLTLVKDFLAKTARQHWSIPHSLLTWLQLKLFPRLKSALNGRHFCIATDIIENVTEGLKRFNKTASVKFSSTFTVTFRSVQLNNATTLRAM